MNNKYLGVIKMLDLTKFKRVMPPQSANENYIRITSKNIIALSRTLKEEFYDKKIDVHYSEDLKTLIIKNDDNNLLKVKKNGEVRTEDLSESLKNAKIKIPCKYTAKWDSKNNMWICTFDETYKPTNTRMSTSMPKSPRKNKPKEMRI